MDREVVGEAYWEFRGDDTKLRKEVADTEEAVKASGTRGGNAFTNAMGSATSKVKGFFGDLGNVAKGMLAVFAAQQVVSFIGDAVSAAREETAGVAQLTASLEANSAAYDGNIESIEKVIEQRMALGFADDAQRESLAGLTAITKDHNKALDLQRTAMDLARLRNIDLRTATDILGKVYGGNLGILSRYGIQLDKNATSTEAIAAIQAMSAGQAEKWANSEAGAAETAQLAMGELTEDIGQLLLPVMTELAKFTRDVIIPGLRELVKVVGWVGDNIAGPIVHGVENIINSFREASGDIHYFAMNFGEEGDRVHAIADRYGITFDDLKDRIRDRMLETGESFDEAATYIEDRARETAVELPATMDEGLRATHQVVVDRGAQIKAAWTPVAEYVPQSIRDRWDDIRAAAYQQAVEHAKGLLDGQNQVKTAIDATNQIIEEEMTKAEEIAYLEGQQAELERARGLAVEEGRTASVNAIDATNALIEARLAELTSDAGRAGAAFWTTWAGAAERNAWRAVNVVSGTAARIRGFMPSSEPKEGPLKGITDAWGFMDVWAGGLERRSDRPVSAIAQASRAMRDVAMALMPAPPMAIAGAMASSGGLAVAGPAGGGYSAPNQLPAGGVNERHIHIHAIQGYPILENESDLLRTAQDAMWFDEMSVTGGE